MPLRPLNIFAPLVMAHTVMAYMVLAYVVMAYVVIANVVMAYMVMIPAIEPKKKGARPRRAGPGLRHVRARGAR